MGSDLAVISEKQLVRDRQAWARGLVIKAWRRVEFLASVGYTAGEGKELADDALRDACAIAGEWGLDYVAVVQADELARTEAAGR